MLAFTQSPYIYIYIYNIYLLIINFPHETTIAMEKRKELKKKKGCIIYPIYIFYFWHSPLQHPFSTEGAIFKLHLTI